VATLPFVTAGHAGRDESDANHGTRSGSPADAGPGTSAGWGRRAVALVIDWVVANLIAFAIVRRPDVWQAPVDGLDFLPLAAFGLEVWLLTAFLGASLGHRVCGLVLVRPSRASAHKKAPQSKPDARQTALRLSTDARGNWHDGKQPVGLWRALIRTALLLLVIPVFVIGRALTRSPGPGLPSD
jgi:hypothetical protein